MRQRRLAALSSSPLPTVLGDLPLLRQVLRNLFSNAIKYTQRQPNPVIRFACALDGRQFVFSITDNGVGFDQQYAGKLFGVFQRLHRVEDFEGTGIGLANVRRIVGRHGGKCWADGKLNQGATFYFTLPAVFPEKGTNPS
jgi:chemotaxis family two-component system sensor kinase Cph1